MYNFGRIPVRDDRDMLYSVAPMLMQVPRIREKWWWDNGWWGNQRTTPHCVAYSWSHWMEDGPVIQDGIMGRRKPVFDTEKFYHVCQKLDDWPGENYAGTSVRAGAKVLQKVGIISEYRWAFNIDEIINTLLTIGPMVVGTQWTEKMQFPNRNGLIKYKGRKMGGHAYVLNGVNLDEEYFRIKNSWGKSWGDRGHGYIRFSDFEKLYNDDGEACVAGEVKITNVPSLATVIPES